MMYKVIARKCRPQTFEEVIGQHHVTRTLQNAIRDRRIAQAFLFTGERGIGKTSVARILSKALNCHVGLSEHPCGTCVSCNEITDGNSIDVHEIDGASNTGVDDIRALRESVKYMPSRDRYKIYIIDEVHMLSTSAFNALLKTLEEPPSHIIFIFATTEPQKIPDTIISRCLRFDFKRIPAKMIVEHLEYIAQNENVRISRRGLFLIARESDGSMRDAQTFLERAISYCGSDIQDSDLEDMLGHIDRRLIYRVMEAVLSEDPQGCIDGLNEVYEFGVDLKRFYYSFIGHLRNLIIRKATNNVSKLADLADEDLKIIEDFASRISLDDLRRCFRLWFSSEGEIVRSALPKIALEICLLEMVHIKRSIPVDDIISRIDGLKKHFEGSMYALEPSQRDLEARQDKRGDSIPQVSSYESKDSETFIDFVRKKHPPIASILEHGSIMICDDNTIKIQFSAGSFFLDKIKEVETETKLRKICDEFFHKEIKLTISATEEKKLYNKNEKGQSKIKNEQQALHNPIIQKVLETFNGKIIDIRTDL